MSTNPLANYFTTTQNCTSVSPECPTIATVYGYAPNLAANAFFCAWFAVLVVAQLALGLRYRTWTFSRLVGVGCLSEMIGYIGRIQLHQNPWSNAGFETQICTLIFAPSFFAGAIYLTLKHMVRAVGPQFSVISAVLYPWIFLTCDFISLLLQAVGGATAATATTPSGTATGGHIMLAGIVFQVATFTVLYALVIAFAVKFSHGKDSLSEEARKIVYSRDFAVFGLGILLASIFVYVRCVYRIAELANGWANPIMRSENEFIVLDGVMCAVAGLVLTVCHPGVWFKTMSSQVDSSIVMEKVVESDSDSEMKV